MGFLSEIKKLLFVNKSIAKSAANKSMDYTKEKGEDLLDTSKEMLSDLSEDIGDKASGLRDAIFDGGQTVIESAKEKAKDISEALAESKMVQKTADVAETVGEKIIEHGSDALDKAKNVTEELGTTVIEKGGKIKDTLEGKSEDIGSKILEAKDTIVEKAKDISDQLGEKLSETIEKAEAFHKNEALKPKRDFAEETLDTGDSFIKDKDDFFSKADRYADGDHGAFSEGKISITESDQISKKPISKIAGFEDLDGDGNELIDDAIISEEEE